MENEQDPNRTDYSNVTYSDVKVIVGGKEFFVFKGQLARNIPYFQDLFFGKFREANKDVVELKDVCPQAFQIFLECCDGRFSVNDDNVSGVAQLADMFLSPIVQDHCVNWLMKESDLALIDKFDISCSSNLHEVKEATIAEMIPAELAEAKDHPRCGEEALRLIIARLLTFVPVPVAALPEAIPVVEQFVVPLRQDQLLAQLMMQIQQDEQHRQQQMQQQREHAVLQLEQPVLQAVPFQHVGEQLGDQQRQQFRQNFEQQVGEQDRELQQQLQRENEALIQQMREPHLGEAFPPAIQQPPLLPRQQNRDNRIPRIRRQ